MNKIEETLKNIDLSEFDIYGGDCVNIATALRRVFSGRLIASYANEVDFHNGYPAHCAVVIDGELYDGGGKTTESALRDRAYYGGGKEEFDEIVVKKIDNPDYSLYDEEKIRNIVALIKQEVR